MILTALGVGLPSYRFEQGKSSLLGLGGTLTHELILFLLEKCLLCRRHCKAAGHHADVELGKALYTADESRLERVSHGLLQVRVREKCGPEGLGACWVRQKRLEHVTCTPG